MKMNKFGTWCVILGLASIGLAMPAGCSSYKDTGETAAQREQTLVDRSYETIEDFKQRDPSLDEFFDSAYGYAIFPTIGKGGLGVGGAHGRGVVFEQGRPVGYATLSQGTIGFQIGGQAFSEVIFFRTQDKLEDFKEGNLEFAAQASAVAVESGVGASSDYEEGTATFILPRGGLMGEAAIGGQKFSYTPM